MLQTSTSTNLGLLTRVYVLVVHEGPFVVSATVQVESSQKAMACAAATLLLLVFSGQVMRVALQ
jgi:hypothetical protein